MSGAYIPADLRRLVHDRTNGRCEYCGLPEALSFAPHQIDHIIAEKHGGPTDSDNLALCCTLCNRYKGSDIAAIDPQSGEMAPLFHPRRQRWADHFLLDADGALNGNTPEGRATIRSLQLNHPERMEERRLLMGGGLWFS